MFELFKCFCKRTVTMSLNGIFHVPVARAHITVESEMH